MQCICCEVCNMKFKTKKCLKAHLKSKRHLLWSEAKPLKQYKCKCGKVFAHRQSLYLHKKSCTNIKMEENVDTLKTLIVEEGQMYEEECVNEDKTLRNTQEISELKEEISRLKSKITELSKLRTNTRRGINKHIRKEVITEQNDKCNTCNKQLTEYNVNIDHKIGVQFGGTNDLDNLQALCVECHNEKTIKERRNRKKIQAMIEQILSE